MGVDQHRVEAVLATREERMGEEKKERKKNKGRKKLSSLDRNVTDWWVAYRHVWHSPRLTFLAADAVASPSR